MKTVLIIVGTLVGAIFVVLGASAGYALKYRGQAYPGVRLGSYPLGGFSADGIQQFAEGINNRLAREGITLEVTKPNQDQTTRLVIPLVVGGDDATELLQIDSAKLAAQALAVGRAGGLGEQLATPIRLRFLAAESLGAPLLVQDQALTAIIDNALAPFKDSAHNAGIIFSTTSLGAYSIVPEQAGAIFDASAVEQNLAAALAALNFTPLKVTAKIFVPDIVAADLAGAGDIVAQIIAGGDITLTAVDPDTKARRDWVLTPEQFLPWLTAARDAERRVILTFDQDKLQNFLQTEVAAALNKLATEARFVVKDSKVAEFVGSRSGLVVNIEQTAVELTKAIVERNYSSVGTVKNVSVSMELIEPRARTAAVNDLGIKEPVGAGVSSFQGSSRTRIKNLKTAMLHLNGILIKPGEEFSTNKYAGPYTFEAGFLPEKVIKGNEIKKEIGGGMCQIGTTLFRMAMNSGLPITERRNHSLVVHYYADPVNGNPGTDATLYDPLPDFKFLNDTENYLLLETAIDEKRQELTFTLWGTKDGRRGGYTHPLVSRWIPSGAPQEVAVSDGTLKVGERVCQDAYQGAVASFTYNRVTPQGEKIDQVFKSFYRPLPKICRVGVAATTTRE